MDRSLTINASTNTVLILGAGAMGAGIAQVAATAGWKVLMRDVNEEVVQRAIAGIAVQLDRLVEKQRLSRADRDAIISRIRASMSDSDSRDCDLLIEAIVEDFDVKTKVLKGLIGSLRDDCVIASNTSSLSITQLGDAIGAPGRTAGMHFFNPAPVMKLVEVIGGRRTDPDIVDRVVEIARSWGKAVARANDVPGFIVNHVARPYYLEAFRIVEDGLAGPVEVDTAMKDLGGFRMGPLELTDLIGQDVNAATTRSVWERLERTPLLAPSRLQEQLVREGHLGRKTKLGVYDYTSDSPVPAYSVERNEVEIPPTLRETASEFAEHAIDPAARGQRSLRPVFDPEAQTRRELGTKAAVNDLIFSRILIAIIAQAHLAFERGVASREDIDTAMKFGVNYPMGPFEWTRQVGADRCVALLDALNETVRDKRFRVPESLRTTE